MPWQPKRLPSLQQEIIEGRVKVNSSTDLLHTCTLYYAPVVVGLDSIIPRPENKTIQDFGAALVQGCILNRGFRGPGMQQAISQILYYGLCRNYGLSTNVLG